MNQYGVIEYKKQHFSFIGSLDMCKAYIQSKLGEIDLTFFSRLSLIELGDDDYNGWVNYHTWLMNLHLTNDYTIHNRLCDLLQTEKYQLADMESKIKQFKSVICNYIFPLENLEESTFKPRNFINYLFDDFSGEIISDKFSRPAKLCEFIRQNESKIVWAEIVSTYESE